MGTQKLEFSLRLRHPTASLYDVTKSLELQVSVLWNKGEQKKHLDQSDRAGVFDNSYCSLVLPIPKTTELAAGLSECMEKLKPKSAQLIEFVRTGGTASLAVAWFSDAVGGDTVPSKLLAELSQMNLNLDFYLYSSPPLVEASNAT